MQQGWVVFLIVLYFSRLGNLKLGQPNSEPDFPTASWFMMVRHSCILFCSFVLFLLKDHIHVPDIAPPGAQDYHLGSAMGLFPSWAASPLPDCELLPAEAEAGSARQPCQSACIDIGARPVHAASTAADSGRLLTLTSMCKHVSEARMTFPVMSACHQPRTITMCSMGCGSSSDGVGGPQGRLQCFTAHRIL